MLVELFGKPVLGTFAAAHGAAGEESKHCAWDAVSVSTLAIALLDQGEDMAGDPRTGHCDGVWVGGNALCPALGGGELATDGGGNQAILVSADLAKIDPAQTFGPGAVGDSIILGGTAV